MTLIFSHLPSFNMKKLVIPVVLLLATLLLPFLVFPEEYSGRTDLSNSLLLPAGELRFQSEAGIADKIMRFVSCLDGSTAFVYAGAGSRPNQPLHQTPKSVALVNSLLAHVGERQ
jgi:hypothetical protein